MKTPSDALQHDQLRTGDGPESNGLVVNCRDALRPVTEHGAACHPVGLTVDALFTLRMCQLRGKLRSAPKAAVPGTFDTYARRLQDALVAEKLLVRVPGGWLRITSKGQQLAFGEHCQQAAPQCVRGWEMTHNHPLLQFGDDGFQVVRPCDMRPTIFKVVSGAILNGRFSELCA